MPRRFTVDGAEWIVMPSGRNTQYVRDEFGLRFTRMTGERVERVARYSPRDARSRELSLSTLTDADLRDLLGTSQPAYTAPETGYRR
ncbi:MAG TPA: hypothetical protein VFI13_00875 [Gemmatimonadales bacterium]|nr:hypothetical protein [Gemmatimonadales bacterium]